MATLAHELRNPLAPIRSGLELLRLKGPPVPELEQARDVIDRQVRQMTRLVDDLLDLSRITLGKITLRQEPLCLLTAVANAVEVSRPSFEAGGHELVLDLPTEPMGANVDLVRLTQVFSNLLNNAAKYTEPCGKIWLKAVREGDEAVVSVKDTGIGIAADHLPRLFEMFSQVAPALERSQGGLGIGLALARGLVHMHGGTIEALSDGPMKGSEFIVRLPLVDLEEPVQQDPAPEIPQPAPAGLRILVVDDNRDAADCLRNLLSLLGHEAKTAYDGAQAVEMAEEYRPEVILLDIGLPKLDGYGVANSVRQTAWGKDVLLVALTGWGQDEDKRRATQAGFDHHMTKPVDFKSLGDLLSKLARSSDS